MVSLGLLLGGLDSSSLSLFLKFLFSLLLSLHSVDGLDQDSLVLELVTLGSKVEVMVDILSDLLGLSVLLEQSSQDSLSSHVEHLGWHTGVSGSSSLSLALVSALSLGLMDSLNSGLGVHVNVLSNNKTILEEFSDVFSYDKSAVNH